MSSLPVPSLEDNVQFHQWDSESMAGYIIKQRAFLQRNSTFRPLLMASASQVSYDLKNPYPNGFPLVRGTLQPPGKESWIGDPWSENRDPSSGCFIRPVLARDPDSADGTAWDTTGLAMQISPDGVNFATIQNWYKNFDWGQKENCQGGRVWFDKSNILGLGKNTAVFLANSAAQKISGDAVAGNFVAVAPTGTSKPTFYSKGPDTQHAWDWRMFYDVETKLFIAYGNGNSVVDGTSYGGKLPVATSPDLKSWTNSGYIDLPDLQEDTECPAIFFLYDKITGNKEWYLQVCRQLGGPIDGSQGVRGEWAEWYNLKKDGVNFTVVGQAHRFVWGAFDYAQCTMDREQQDFTGPDDSDKDKIDVRCVGQVNNWGVSFIDIPQFGFRGTTATSWKCISVNGSLVVLPPPEIYMRHKSRFSTKLSPNGATSMPLTGMGRIWTAKLTSPSIGGAGSLNFEFGPNHKIAVNFSKTGLLVDYSKSGDFNYPITTTDNAAWPETPLTSGKPYEIFFFYDTGVLVMFAVTDGICGTSLTFPPMDAPFLTGISADKGAFSAGAEIEIGNLDMTIDISRMPAPY